MINSTIRNRTPFFRQFWKQRYLQLMIIPVIIWLFLFKYLPILGVQIAFRNYRFVDGIWGSSWTGLENVREVLSDVNIYRVTRNTLGISWLKLIFNFPMPIIFALLLNEVRNVRFKRVVQTVSYFPHFIAYSIVAVMITLWLSPSAGFVNEVLVGLGLVDKPILFLGRANMFWWIIVVVDIWKNIGWGSIIYLAAITGIDQNLYEAATVDGAGRFKQMLHITLPSIRPTIVALFILQVGNIFHGANFDLCYLLGNTLNITRSDILDTYVLRMGISLGRFSYATAVGLLLSLISMSLVLAANTISKKTLGEGLF
ncbi:MAG: ABC transporter permease subunit [Bacillota bacterium]|nr:ABC transporter permease subunit [Bacillota bacterium]